MALIVNQKIRLRKSIHQTGGNTVCAAQIGENGSSSTVTFANTALARNPLEPVSNAANWFVYHGVDAGSTLAQREVRARHTDADAPIGDKRDGLDSICDAKATYTDVDRLDKASK
jgi:hypothetical protein